MAKTQEIKIQFSIDSLQSSLEEMRRLKAATGGSVKEIDAAIDMYSSMIEKMNSLGGNIPIKDMNDFTNSLIKINKVLLKTNESLASLKFDATKYNEYKTKIDETTKSIKALEDANKELKQKRKTDGNNAAKEFFNNNEIKSNINFSKMVDGRSNAIVQLNKKLEKKHSPQVTEYLKQALEAATKATADLTDKIEKNEKEIKEYNTQLKQFKQTQQKYSKGEGLNPEVVQGQLDVVKGQLQASSDQYDSAYHKIDVAIGQHSEYVNSNLHEENESINDVTGALIKWRLVWTTLRKVVNDAIRTVKQMDEAITGLTVVTGKSREEALKYVSTFRKISEATSSTMTEVANLTTEYLRQGRTMSDALELAEQTAKAAKISGLSTSATIQYMTAAINGFNLAATDAAHVSDVFANVAAKSATSYEQLATALSKVSAQANLAGMSMEYTTALLAKGIETTQEAPESIGTALKTVLARMRELTDYGSTLEEGMSVNNVETALASAGIALRDEAGAFRNLTDIFNELGPKWDNLNTMQQQAIAQAVAGTRQQARFIAIMQDWDRTLEITTEAQESANAANYQASQYQKGLEATVSRLETAWQGFVTSIIDTEGIVKIVDELGKGLSGIVNILDNKVVQVTVRVLVASLVTISALQAKTLVQEKIHNVLLAIRAKTTKQTTYNDYQSYLIKNKSLKTLKKEQAIYAERIVQNKQELDNLTKRLSSEQQITEEERKQLVARKAQIEAEQKSLGVKLADVSGTIPSNVAPNYGKLLFQKDGLTNDNLNTLSKDNTTGGLLKTLVVLKNRKQIQAKITALEQDENFLTDGTLKIQRDNLKIQKESAVQSAKSLAKQAGIALAIAAIAVAVKKTVQYYEKLHDIESDLQEIDNQLYENKQNRNNLEDLIKEYRRLQATMNKTADEQERMAEIEKTFESDYGITQSNYLDGAYDKLSDYYQEQSKLYADQLADAQLYFNHYGNIENKALQKSLKARMDYYNKISIAQSGLSESTQGYATDMSGNITNNLDYAALLKQGQNISAKDRAAINAKAVGTYVGYTLAGAAAGALLGAGFGSALGPAGTVVVGAAGAVIGAVTGVVRAVYVRSEAYAKKAAVKTNEEMNKVQTEITSFSVSYGEKIDELTAAQNEGDERFTSGLALRSQAFLDALNENLNNYSESTRQALLEYQKTYQVILDNIDTIEDMASKLGMSDDTFQKLVEQYGQYGDEAAKAFLESYQEAMDNADAYFAANPNDTSSYNSKVTDYLYSQASKGQGALYQAVYDAEYQRLQNEIDAINSTSDKVYKSQNGLETNEQAAIAKNNEINKLMQEQAQLTATVKNLIKTDAINLTSAIQDKATFDDRYTSLTSAIKNIDELISQVSEGNISSSTIQSLSERLDADMFQKLMDNLNSGSMGAVMSQLSALKQELTTETTDTINKAIEVQQTLMEDAETSSKSLYEGTIRYMEELKDLATEYSEAKLRSLRYTYQESLYTKDIEKGIISGYENYDKLLNAKLQDNKESVEALRKTNTYFDDLLRRQREGNDITEEYSKMSEAERKSFYQYAETANQFYDAQDDLIKQIVDNTEKWQSALISLQDTITKQYKDKLKEEQDALKESLNRRKELYKKYFAALTEEDNEQEFLSEQVRLQKAIANLAAASDSASLSKRKEYEQQLADLESTYRDDLRSQREDAVITNLDNQADAATVYYDRMTTNTQAIIDLLKGWDDAKMMALLTSSSAYKNASNAQKQQLMEEWRNNFSQLRGFSSGGRVDFTGPAMLHGTPSSPEWVLNSQQAEALRGLLSPVYSTTNGSNNNNQSVNIEGLNIVLNGGYDPSNAKATGDSLAQALFDGIRRTGIAINIKK